MPRIELVCLANSRKHAGRCVAGITEDRRWLRPVSALPDGRLTEREYLYADGSEPALLDVVSLTLGEAVPLPHQPENVLLAAGRWSRSTRLPRAHVSPTVQALIAPGPELLGSRTGSVAIAALKTRAGAASLALAEPRELSWEVRENLRGWPQVRAHFTLGNQPYDLVVTDPRFEQEAAALGFGCHARDAVASLRDHRVLFTVSLGEPLEGYCYKLVAAVLALPEE